MITPQQAEQIILQHTMAFDNEYVPLHQAVGHILAEDIQADRDFPPFNRVTMDGIALQYATLENQDQAVIESVAAAGANQQVLQNPDACIEVMTGAVMPEACDTVVRYEDLKIENGIAHFLEKENYFEGKNVHKQGKDRSEREVLIPKNTLLTPAEISVAATVGKANLLVKAIPQIAIIATGDELVDVNEIPLPHQIRSSNVYTLQAALNQWKVPSQIHHLKDDKQKLTEAIQEIIKTNKVLVLSGGVSKGKFDFVPEVLESLGIQKKFHRLAQRPGKPFWFGASNEGVLVFALPGNPISSFMCLHRYVQTWLKACLQQSTNVPSAILAQDFEFAPQLTYYLQVKTHINESGQCIATPQTGNGSGDLANLTLADAFLELPAEKTIFKQGGIYRIFPFKGMW